MGGLLWSRHPAGDSCNLQSSIFSHFRKAPVNLVKCCDFGIGVQLHSREKGLSVERIFHPKETENELSSINRFIRIDQGFQTQPEVLTRGGERVKGSDIQPGRTEVQPEG